MNALIAASTTLFETFIHSNRILECVETNAQPGKVARSNWIKAQAEDHITGQVITFYKEKKPGSRKLNDVDSTKL